MPEARLWLRAVAAVSVVTMMLSAMPSCATSTSSTRMTPQRSGQVHEGGPRHRHPPRVPWVTSVRGGAAGQTGTAEPGHHQKKPATQRSSQQHHLKPIRHVTVTPDKPDEAHSELPLQLQLHSAPPSLDFLNGVFVRTEDHNGRAHYERVVNGAELDDTEAGERVVHLYWHSTQWILHYDLDPAINYENSLGYCKVNSKDPRRTDKTWYLREKHKWVSVPDFRVTEPGEEGQHVEEEAGAAKKAATSDAAVMPSRLLPIYITFLMDAVASGVASPLLPFLAMDLGATKMQLGTVFACNYISQTAGCIIMGNVSDKHGRRKIMLGCLFMSMLSLLLISRAKNLVELTFGRMVGGMLGGFVPLAQSAIADSCPLEARPKFLGRLQAVMGAGFVLGPVLSLTAGKTLALTNRQKIRCAAVLPLLGFMYGLVFIRETKDPRASHRVVERSWVLPSLPIRLLVVNGFCLVYAFAVETFYAAFLKDNFGYQDGVLNMVLATNGVAVAVLQVFLIRNLFSTFGKHGVLLLGNFLMAGGMVGLALLRNQFVHFLLFTLHIIGYAISDTALASLISRYSSSDAQGKNLGWSHAAQSCARIVSPLVAGWLYDQSKRPGHPLPPGALPYLAGSVMPLLGMSVPTILYLRSVNAKKAAAAAGSKESLRRDGG